MYEFIQQVKAKYEEHGDAYFIDKYRLPYGLYIRINKDLSITEEDILYVQSKKEEDFVGQEELYYWFQQRNFYSNYVDSNKAIDATEKKIFSTVPYAFFLKRANLIDQVEKLGSVNMKKIERNDLTNEEIYQYFVHNHYEQMQIVLEKEADYDFYENYFIQHANEFTEIANEWSLKGTVTMKFFFDEEVSAYKDMQESYLSKKTFLSDSFEEVVDGEKLNAWSFQTGLNAKKPHLFYPSTSFEIPYRTTIENSVLAYKASLVLNEIAKEIDYDIRTDTSRTVLFLQKKDKRIRKEGYREFKILQVENYQDILVEGEIFEEKTRKDIEVELSRMFKQMLYDLYYLDSSENLSDYRKKFKSKWSDNQLLNVLIMARHTLKSYFVDKVNFDISKEIEAIFDIIFHEEVEQLTNYQFLREVRKLWDTQISLLSHFSGGKKHMNLPKDYVDMRTYLVQKLNESNEEVAITDDKMFYYLSGQVLYFLVSQNKSKNVSGRILTPFLNMTDPNTIKEEIANYYQIYAHELPLYSESRISKAIHSLLIYQPIHKGKGVSLHFLRAGIIGHNLFYTKKEQVIEEEVVNEESK